MRTTLLTLAVLCTAFAPVPAPRPGRGERGRRDLAALQGEWKFAWSHKAGVREDGAQDSRWLITGDRLETTFMGRPASKLTLSLDPRTGSIDLRDAGSGRVVPGRY